MSNPPASPTIITATSASKLPTPQQSNRHAIPLSHHITSHPIYTNDALIDFTKTPRSLEIRREENAILRMPDSVMMFQAQQNLHDMLEDIHEDPGGFTEYVGDRRDALLEGSSLDERCNEPIDLTGSGLDDYSTNAIPVGKGRFSVVYNTRSKATGVEYALKKIKLASSGMVKANAPANESQDEDKNFLTKCLKEVGLLRSMRHPNIVEYQDCFISTDSGKNQSLYIVLEWAGNGDLKNIITKARTAKEYLSESVIWTYFSQCTEAVLHMHQNRIIHRDIKPSNILIMSNGTLKLGDLGLGRYLGYESLLAFSQVGTPLYMSPEVLRGEGHDFGSDIWSLGCLLYEITMLRTPFQQKGLTMDKLFLKIVRGEFPPIPEPFSLKLRQMCNDCIMVEPKERPAIERVASAALLNRTSASLLSSGGSLESCEGDLEESSNTLDETTSLSNNHDESECSSDDSHEFSPDVISRPQHALPGIQVTPLPLPLLKGNRAAGTRESGRRVSFDPTYVNELSECAHEARPAAYDEDELRLMDELVLSARKNEEVNPYEGYEGNGLGEKMQQNGNVFEPGLSRTVSVMEHVERREEEGEDTKKGLPPVVARVTAKDDSEVFASPNAGKSGFLRRLSGLISVGRKSAGSVGGGKKITMGKEDVKRLKEERKKAKAEERKMGGLNPLERSPLDSLDTEGALVT